MDGKILVTGGAGYVGSHVVVALAEAGYTPIVLDNFANSSRAALPRLSALTGRTVDLVEADVRDRTALRRLPTTSPGRRKRTKRPTPPAPMLRRRSSTRSSASRYAATLAPAIPSFTATFPSDRAV